jgi:hypothetical protein
VGKVGETEVPRSVTVGCIVRCDDAHAGWWEKQGDRWTRCALSCLSLIGSEARAFLSFPYRKVAELYDLASRDAHACFILITGPVRTDKSTALCTVFLVPSCHNNFLCSTLVRDVSLTMSVKDDDNPSPIKIMECFF